MTDPNDKRSFENILTELEQQVERLERGDLPLEEALDAFNRGMVLAQEGGDVLSAAEKSVESLLAVHEDGSTETQPLDPA